MTLVMYSRIIEFSILPVLVVSILHSVSSLDLRLLILI